MRKCLHVTRKLIAKMLEPGTINMNEEAYVLGATPIQ